MVEWVVAYVVAVQEKSRKKKKKKQNKTKHKQPFAMHAWPMGDL